MLNTIFAKLLSPIKISKTVANPPITTPLKKHLVIQTVYSSCNSNLLNNASLDISNDTKSSPVVLTKALLEKQKEILLDKSKSKYASIEQVTLDDNTALIGLTKHPHPILRGIFMFPDNIRYTNEWNAMKNQALCLNASIAIFRPLHELDCLKITKHNNIESCCYLVDHRAIQRVRWLLPSSSLEATCSTENNHNLFKK